VTSRLELGECLRAVESAAQGTDSADLEALLNYGPSLGGARPKANIVLNGRLHLAKFSVSFDRRDKPTLEYATMQLARAVGLNVPPIDLRHVAGRRVYLTERFDRCGDIDGLQPIAFMSGLTATGLHERDYGQWSYRSLCDAIGKFSENPKEDKAELFRRMIFNILVNNNDDHMRNHGFLGTGRGGWRLSPLYDVVPGHSRGESYHLALRVGQQGSLASFANARTSAQDFGLSQQEAKDLIDSIAAKTRNWSADFKTHGVDDDEIERLSHYVKVK
jgi:serine/threonine-protein kinase HipA